MKPGSLVTAAGVMAAALLLAAPEIYPATASPGGGAASADPAGILQAIARSLKPKVTGSVGLVEPGMTFIASGSGFGSALGEGTLAGEFGTRKLGVVQWTPRGIAFKVPDDIAGVGDGPARLVVETSDGRKSDPFAVDFRARRTVVRLKAADVAATSCAATAARNRCNWTVKAGPGAKAASDEPWTGCVVKAGASLCGWHEGAAGPGGTASGTDTYRIELENGWTLYDRGELVSGSIRKEKVATLGEGFTEGATSWSPKVDWRLGEGARATYAGDVFIVGPKGVPFGGAETRQAAPGGAEDAAEGEAPEMGPRKEAFARFAKEQQARRAAEAAKINEALARLQRAGRDDGRAARLEAIRQETLAIQSRGAGPADQQRLQQLRKELDALIK